MASKTKPAGGQDAPGERPDAITSPGASPTDGIAPGVQLAPPKVGVPLSADGTDLVAGVRRARTALEGLTDPSGLVVAALAEEARAESQARRYQEIPAEGVAIEADDLDLLAVHLDLDPGTVIAARQHRDRLVWVTRDGRKVEKGMR